MKEVIKQHRVKNGLTQEQLAVESGLTQSYISQIEKGTRNPTMETLESMARVFRVKKSDLMKESEEYEIGRTDHAGFGAQAARNDYGGHDVGLVT